MKGVKMKIATALMPMFFAGQVAAHHSVAAFDRENPGVLSGTVKEFKMTNPHTWLYVMVPDGKGGEEEWAMEGGAVNMVVRKGWTKDTIKAGMPIKLLIAPRKDGALGGEWLQVLELDGKPME